MGDDIVAAVGEEVLGEEIVVVVLGFAAAASFGGVWVGIVEYAVDRSIIRLECRLRGKFGVAVGIVAAAAAAADENCMGVAVAVAVGNQSSKFERIRSRS